MTRWRKFAPLAALLAVALSAAGLIEGVATAAEPLAKTLFGAQKLPASRPRKPLTSPTS